jgi:UDP-glucuronate decarboxylase
LGASDGFSFLVGQNFLAHLSEHRELAELILELIGSRSKIVHRPLPQDDPQKKRPDISEAESVVGWHPTVALREGLAKTIPSFEQLVTQADVPVHNEESKPSALRASSHE